MNIDEGTRRPIFRNTDGQEYFDEKYYSVMTYKFNSFDTLVELKCTGEKERFTRACVCYVDIFKKKKRKQSLR